MATNVDLTKTTNENSANLLRRFTKLFRSTNITKEIRNRRYYVRSNSDLKNKKRALRKIELTEKYDEMRKLGKTIV